MSHYYNVVPWYNSEEWHQVYDKIWSINLSVRDQKNALNVLKIWKVRCPSLPSGIESTLSLLNVHLEDINIQNDGTDRDEVLRLAYSSAIMRFVNHTLDSETAKGASLYQAAKNLDVPDWVIDLRHDTAHNHNLPSISLLRDAASICLQWLKVHYWDQHREHIKDYMTGNTEVYEIDDNEIEIMLNLYISLGICINSFTKVKNVADIPDPSLKESITNDIKDLFGNQMDLSKPKTISLLAMIYMLNERSKKIASQKKSKQIQKVLLGNDPVILSIELFNLLSNNEFHNSSSLSRNFVQSFELLLKFLHSNNLVLQFLLDLIQITLTRVDLPQQARQLAAFWVCEILKALKRSKMFVKKMALSASDRIPKTKDDLVRLFFHWFPNERSCNLLLDLQKDAPQELSDINFIQPIISKYNPYLKYFINELLDLLEPQLSKVTSERIVELAELIAVPKGYPMYISNVHTVDDLKEALQDNDDDESDSDCIEVELDDTYKDNIESDVYGNWKLASNQCDWATCPIGILPWQR